MRFKNKKIRNLFLIFCLNNLISYFVKWSTFLLTATGTSQKVSK